MTDQLLDILMTFGMAMLPILEVRGAIPFAIGVLGMPVQQAFLWAVLGNITIVFILLTFLDPVTKVLMKHSKWFDKFLTNLFHKTRHKHTDTFNELGAIFLIGFVAIPLPVTGAWTGSLIAFLFGIRFFPAFPLIATGVVGAATLISLGFESVTAIFHAF
jgi:uncharacterized membrane protein